ncbi:MAG: glycosyltransferase family 2 protein [Ferruginibacter sp.]
MNKVLIAITSKNRVNILPKAIDSALMQQYANKEVVVFDDNSTDATPGLAKKYTNVTWHFSKVEIGYLAARNMLLQTTDATYFCSLDDDSWFLQNDQLSKAVEYMDASPKVAVLAFSILSNDLTKEIQRGDVIAETNSFIGCGHMIRVSAARDVGFYAVNPGFYGGEEKDLCILLMDKDYSIVRFPDVEVWHDKSNVSRDFRLQYRSLVCNDLVFMWRRTPFLYLLPSFFIKLYKHLVYSITFRGKNLVMPLLKGCADFFAALLTGKAKRKAISVKTFKKYLSFNQ